MLTTQAMKCFWTYQLYYNPSWQSALIGIDDEDILILHSTWRQTKAAWRVTKPLEVLDRYSLRTGLINIVLGFGLIWA
jgi:hypothetical protein